MTDYGDELAPGTRLEEFEIERTLGTGGFGVTYLAWDRSLDRRVAIKEYLPRDWGSRRADGSVGPRSASDVQDYQWGLDRFLAEARILAQLEHPHIVRAHRVIPAAHGTAYMVMEYVEGRSLREELAAEGTLSETRVRHILGALTAGLEPVHAKGLLHRDIKPANVMLRLKDDTPVLIDFGAARQVIGQQSRSVTSVLTPGYAAIELYETHGHQGPWTDIYALGALAYVSLTGRLPEDATSRVRNDLLRPLGETAGGAVSRGLAMAVAAALQVNESDRPQDLGAWRTLLDMPAGEEVTSVVEEGAPAEESTPARVESAAESTPAAGSVLLDADLDTPPSVSRSRLYAVAAGIVGAVLLGVLLVSGARTGGEVGTDTGTSSSAAADDSAGEAAALADDGAREPAALADDGAGEAAALADDGAGGTGPDTASGAASGGAAPDAGTVVDGSGAAEPSTEVAGNEPTGGLRDDRGDVTQAEAALELDREDRRAVQEGLVAEGFDPGVPDGTFGDRTRAALREWQSAQGMEETGYLDRASAEALAAAAPVAEAASAETPAVEAASAEVVVAELAPSPSPSPDPPTKTRLETPDDDPVPTAREPPPPPTSEPTRDVDSPPAPRTAFSSCTDCPEMVVVPPGTFRMGSSEGQGDERPVHNVGVGIFAMGRYEVTRGEYSSFVTATDHASAGCNVVDRRGENLNWDSRASWRNPGFAQSDDHPVVCVGWEDALAYARWLSTRTGERYRLPSEAEWEYAARAETATGRYWDGGSTGQCGNANGGDRTLLQRRGSWTPGVATCTDGVVDTAQVGTYAPNAFRLHDMLGNVWEWVADCWHDNYQGAPADGSAWGDGNCGRRVLRGGSWDTTPRGLRSANRYTSGNSANNNAGFRVVREFRGRGD